MILYPDPPTSLADFPVSAFLLSGTVSVTCPQPTFGKEPAALMQLVLKRRPPWENEFRQIYSVAHAQHSGFEETVNALQPLVKSLGVLALSYATDIKGLEHGDALLQASGAKAAEWQSLIGGNRAATGFFRHLSEQYLDFDKDLEALYRYCDHLYKKNLVPLTLLKVYLTRIAFTETLRKMPDVPLLLTNERLPAFLAQLPVDVDVDEAGKEEERHRLIAWELFQRLVLPRFGVLDAKGVEVLRSLRENKREEIERLRERCSVMAYEVAPSAKAPAFEKVIATKASKEIRELFELDSKTNREYVAGIFSDAKTWAAFAAAVSVLFSGAPLLLSAGGAISALSLVGANGVKAAYQRKEKLRQSDFALLYSIARMR